MLDAFIYYKGSGGPEADFNQLRNWVNVMKAVDYAAQTAIADGILVRATTAIFRGLSKVRVSVLIYTVISLIYGIWEELEDCTSPRGTVGRRDRLLTFASTLMSC